MSDEVATVSNQDITPVGGNGSFVSSFDTTTDKGKIKIFSVLQTSERLEDHMNEPFNLKDVVMQNVEITDAKTGELTPQVRTILVADDDSCYSAVSTQLVSSLRTMFGIFGQPKTWKKPIKVQVVQKRSRAGRNFYDIEPILN